MMTPSIQMYKVIFIQINSSFRPQETGIIGNTLNLNKSEDKSMP